MTEFREPGGTDLYTEAFQMNETGTILTAAEAVAHTEETGADVELEDVTELSGPTIAERIRHAMDNRSEERVASVGRTVYFEVDNDTPSSRDMFVVHTRSSIVLPPNTVACNTLDELREAILVNYASPDVVIDGLDGPTTAAEHTDQTVRHEAAHAEMAERVDQGGHLDGFFVVSYSGSAGNERAAPAFVPAGLTASRLERSMMSIAPHPPSHGDMANVRNHQGQPNVPLAVAAAKEDGIPTPAWVEQYLNPDILSRERTVEKLLDHATETVPVTRREVLLADAFAPVVPQGEEISTFGDLTDPSLYEFPTNDPRTAIRVPGRGSLIIPLNVVPLPEVVDPPALMRSEGVRRAYQFVGNLRAELSTEVERADIARAMGYNEGFWGLVSSVEGTQLRMKPQLFFPGLITSKAGAALLNIGVSEPSDLNYRAMEDLGFKTDADVIVAAEAEGLPIPMALWQRLNVRREG